MTRYRRAGVHKVPANPADPHQNTWKANFMIARGKFASYTVACNYYRTHADAIDAARAWASLPCKETK